MSKIEGYKLNRTQYIILDGPGSTHLKTNTVNKNKIKRNSENTILLSVLFFIS